MRSACPLRPACTAVLILLLGGCGPEETESEFAPVQEILNDNCVARASDGIMCHHPDGISGHIVDYSGNAHDNIVSVSSTSSLDYITPGDPSQSYLWLKVHDLQDTVDGGSGDPMPLGEDQLPDETLAVIEAWIEAGAPK